MKELKLIKRAIKGNEKCLEELLVLHSDQMYRTAFLYVKNREDALDIVQEASVKAFLSISQLRDENFFLTWLTKILINCCYDLLKKKKKESPFNNLIKMVSVKDEIKVENLDLLEAIHHLKENYKNAIILFYFNDLPISEVAKVMNIPENTVKTYLSRGKEQLKKLLGGMNNNGEEFISKSI
jgi:RNA polymerase sigma-70 factor, ECF subfamily